MDSTNPGEKTPTDEAEECDIANSSGDSEDSNTSVTNLRKSVACVSSGTYVAREALAEEETASGAENDLDT